MKILFKLDSETYTKEQNIYLYDNMVEVNWNILMFPREGERIDCESVFDESIFESITREFKDINLNLIWFIDYIYYEKIDGILTPIIWLSGE